MFNNFIKTKKISLLLIYVICINLFVPHFSSFANDVDISQKVRHGVGLYSISSVKNYSYNEYSNMESLGVTANDYYAVALKLDAFDNIKGIKIDHVLEKYNWNINGIEKTDERNAVYSERLGNRYFSDNHKKGADYVISDGNEIDTVFLEQKLLSLKTFYNAMSYLNQDIDKMLPILACMTNAHNDALNSDFVDDGFLGLYPYVTNETTKKASSSNSNNILQSTNYVASVIIDKNYRITNTVTNTSTFEIEISKEGKVLNRKDTIDSYPKENSFRNIEYTNLSAEEVAHKINNNLDYCIGKSILDAKSNR